MAQEKVSSNAYCIFLLIFIPILCLVALLGFTGWEADIARLVHEPHSRWGWFVRNWGTYPAIAMSLILLGYLLIPPIRKKWPAMRRLAVVWLGTLIFAAGLVGSVVLPELLERPRPRETVLLGGPHDYVLPLVPSGLEKGKSTASGHASVGFIFAVPFFIWRKKRLFVAKAFLGLGIAYGFFVGYARMVLGAHFLSDVFLTGMLVVGGAALFAHFFKEENDFPTRYTLGILLLGGLCVVWFNKLQDELIYTGRILPVSLPCLAAELKEGSSFKLHLKYTAYGAPASNIRLLNDEEQGIIVQKWPGLYHDFNCGHLTITLPQGSSVVLPKNMAVTSSKRLLIERKNQRWQQVEFY